VSADGPRWRVIEAGLVGGLPFLPGVLVLGAIWGASALAVGIGHVTAVVMSAIVWSGAGQFAALPLWREGVGIVAASVLMLSLRFSLMAASMAPHLSAQRVPLPIRGLLAFAITDENYALGMTRRAAITDENIALGSTRSSGHLDVWYLLGAWVPLYVGWLVGTVLGVLFGSQVPTQWQAPLSAIFPIVFLTLTVLVCTRPSMAMVAALAAALSVAGALVLPAGWSVLIAGLLASAAGPLLDEVRKR
jgi:predicted branched-subunit amino acid permease